VTASFSVVAPAVAPAANPSSATTSSTSPALTVTVIGSGSVAGNGIACPDECRDGYPLGTTVTLSATPGRGYLFSGWSGAGCSGTGACTVTLAQSTGVTATFTATEAKILPAVSILAVHAKALAFRDRKAKVKLSCAGVKACAGTLELQLRQRGGPPKTIAKGRFHVAARRYRFVTLLLSKSGVTLLAAARHGYRVTLLVTGKTGQRLTVTLTARV